MVFYALRGAVLQNGSASAVFLWGVILSWLCDAVFKLRFYKPTARHGFVCYEFCILRICFCKTGFDFKPRRGFTSRIAADSGLFAALARCHPIWEYIKRFEILFIKS